MASALASTGALAAMLRGAGDDALVTGLQLRGLSANVASLKSIHDFFDLAETLLSDRSLEHCLSRLDRRSLSVLARLSENRMPVDDIQSTRTWEAEWLPGLHARFLVHATPAQNTEEGTATWPEVSAQLAEWPNLGLPDLRAEAPEPGTDAPGAREPGALTPASATQAASAAQHSTDSLAMERAFLATTAIAELLFTLDAEPLRLLATGKIGRPSERKLAEVLRVEEQAVGFLVGIAESAGLIRRHNGTLSSSESHREWLERGPEDRWVVIADAWATGHWNDVRARLGQRPGISGTELQEWLAWNYPGGREWLPAHTAARLHEAELLGITAHATMSTVGTRLLAGAIAAASAILAESLPTPLDRLYLQHDLTAVATGPLQPKIDTRLRTMADVDGHTIASRYRFTKASISRAVNGNETATSILEFLDGITLSGIPQPLEYLVTETAARHGLLRVGTLTAGTPHELSYIRSDDDVLLRTVLIDRNLASLHLRPRDSEYLVSTWEHNELYAALHAAKYPVAIEDAHGRILQAKSKARPREMTSAPVIVDTPDPLRKLVARLRVADLQAPDSSDEAWLARQLDAAIRSKATVTVSVKMPSGNVVDYRLEPAAIFGGRLRARDPLSEIERTLPLSSIVAVSGA